MIRESLSKRGWELERVIPRPRTTRRTDISYLHARDARGLSLFEDFRFDSALRVHIADKLQSRFQPNIRESCRTRMISSPVDNHMYSWKL